MSDPKSILTQVLDTDPIRNHVIEQSASVAVRGIGVKAREPGIPDDAMEAFGRGIIAGLQHRAFMAGARFSAGLSRKDAEERMHAAATEYTRRDEW